MICAAGTLIVSTEGRVLLLQRSAVGDLPGTWCFPGGKIEDGEDACTAAIRETLEEIGWRPPKTRCVKWAQRIACDNGVEPVDFTTFLVKDVKEFTPKLNEEHVAFAWCDPAQPPVGLHPGCLIAFEKLSLNWNELCVAKAIRDGQLTSPQEYENITFFDVRVTGTGEAYRSMKKDAEGNVLYEEEYVWREPALYLTQEFLERCNGVPVILEHPETSTLTTEEYRTRTIGALTLPYIKGEEVWAIARVQDNAAAKIMSEAQLSTSPAVSWNDPAVNVAGKLQDGSNFLIEGKPTLLDHLAICWQGVWDKGGESQGVNIVRGDSMSDDFKKALDELLKQSTTLAGTITGVTTGLEKLTTRLDSVEKRYEDDKKQAARVRVDSFQFSKRIEGETEKAYQARHDAEERALRADMTAIADAAVDSAEIISDRARKARRDAEDREDEFPPKKEAKDEFPPKKEAKDEFPPKKEAKDEDDDGKKAADSKKAADEDEREDEDEDDDKKSKKDSKKADSRKDSLSKLEKEVALLRAGLRPMSDEDLIKVGKLSKRCDSIYTGLGETMPRILPGENLIDYHRKLAADLKKYTKYKDSELAIIAADAATFDVVCDNIFTEAEQFALSPARLKAGELVQRVTRGDSGHVIYTYDGASSAWMNRFAGPVQNHAKSFLTKEAK